MLNTQQINDKNHTSGFKQTQREKMNNLINYLLWFIIG